MEELKQNLYDALEQLMYDFKADEKLDDIVFDNIVADVIADLKKVYK